MHCKSHRCDVCNYVITSSSFMSHTTKRSYNTNYQLDCNSNNVVYLLTCKVWGLQYVGSTTKVGSELMPVNLILTKKATTLSISIFMVLDIMEYGMLAFRLSINLTIMRNCLSRKASGLIDYKRWNQWASTIATSFTAARIESRETDNYLSCFSWCSLFI